MINKKTSGTSRFLAAIVALPVLILCLLLFSGRTVYGNVVVVAAKHTPLEMIDTVPRTNTREEVLVSVSEPSSMNVKISSVIHSGNGVTHSELEEYGNLVRKAAIPGKEKDPLLRNRYSSARLINSELKRMWELFSGMSVSQQDHFPVKTFQVDGPVLKRVPTATEFELFKTSSDQAFFIDDTQVFVSALANYRNTDFDHVFVTTAETRKGNDPATRYTGFVYLLTKEGFKKKNEDAERNPRYVIVAPSPAVK